MGYIKIRFESRPYGHTAGLILEASKYEHMCITELSRLFPYSEALKMQTFQRSPEFPTWEQAFKHDFDAVRKAR